MAYSFNLAVLYLRDKRMKTLIRKRRRRDVCKSHEPSFHIPYELQIEILKRLPAKSLMRFKSVSKIWSSLICSQFFIDHYQKVSSPSLRIYMWLDFEESPFKKVLLSSSSSSSSPSSSSSFVLDQNLTIPAIEGYSVSHVYHGLMCFVKGLSAQIYNTSTRQLVVLPKIEGLKLKYKEFVLKIVYYIGYDPVHNQYKVVCIFRRFAANTEIWVLLLGGDGTSQWRKISIPFQHLPYRRKGSSLIINGCVYYMAVTRQYFPHPMLVSIDLHSEEICTFENPKNSDKADLIEFNGKVALLDYSGLKDHGVMNLWVMEDEEKHIWSSKKALVLDPSQIHGISLLGTQGTTRNGEVIFVPRDKIMVKPQCKTQFYVFLYNIQNNVLRKVEIKEASTSHRTKIWDVIGFDDVETLMHL